MRSNAGFAELWVPRLRNTRRLSGCGMSPVAGPEGENLSQLAYDAGYCDQSHFIKDLKKFTGRPPASFFW